MGRRRLIIIIWHLGIGGMQKRMRDVAIDMSKNHPEWDMIFLVKHKKSSFIAEEICKKTRAKIEYFSTSHYWSNSLLSVFG